MNLTDTEENRLLGLTTTGTRLALVTTAGTDSTAGTEVSGGLYDRRSVNFTTPAAGSVSNVEAIVFIELPAALVVGWELWSTDGTQRRWRGYWSLMSATWSTDVITANAHGRQDGQPIIFPENTCPPDLISNTIYYVRDATLNTFKVAATSGGAVVPIANTGSTTFGRVMDVPAAESLEIQSGQFVLTLA